MSRDLSAPEQRRLLLDSVRDYLEQLAEEGLEGLPAAVTTRAPARQAAAPARAALAPEGAPSPAPATAPPPSAAPARSELLSRYPGLEKTTTVQDLTAFIGDCQRC